MAGSGRRVVARKWILLPGLDGTGLLFDEFARCLPSNVSPVVVGYPTDAAASARDLLDCILRVLPPAGEDYVLIAESFSGPLALRIAGEAAHRPAAVVLCATFGRSAMPRWAAAVAGWVTARVRWRPLPGWAIRSLMAGPTAPQSLIDRFRENLRSVSPAALASRFNVLREFTSTFAPAELSVPILYIRALRDRAIHPRELAFLQSRYPAMCVADIDSAHLVLQSRPEEAAAAIEQFLARVQEAP